MSIKAGIIFACNQSQPLAGIFVSGEHYMTRSPYFRLALILLLVAVAAWIDLSKTINIPNPVTPGTSFFQRNVDIQLGLDLRGGLQTLLEVPEGVKVQSQDLETARTILENRANALGVSEVIMQVAPPRRIVAEFPGVSNPEEVVAALKQTGLLEFVELGDTRLAEGTVVQTDYLQDSTAQQPTTAASATPAATAAPGATPAADATPAAAAEKKIYHTIMTGAELQTALVQATAGNYEISFELKSEGAKIFADYTSKNVGKILAIVLDKKVISAPSINSAIPSGSGVIQGGFTQASANALAVQLRYGSLPVPVQVAESRTVGATLGAESVQKSVLAGAIGLAVVILFMLLYYRVPGFVASLALITYALLSLAIFKVIPVVLTLPGIAGFILSIGMAVDANILIFERMKEELRSGRTLVQAIDLGFRRAWPSIRDSNTSTLITCVILYLFGNAFGASMVKGFSVTLALGVLVSLFTAITVTRTYLHVVMDNLKSAEHPRWFGL
jgi:preprotein translocase subunit SecD